MTLPAKHPNEIDSTAKNHLHPERPIAALPDTDSTLSDAVEVALLNIPENHPALVAANVEGFTDAVDYQSIHDLIETLQLRNWDAN